MLIDAPSITVAANGETLASSFFTNAGFTDEAAEPNSGSYHKSCWWTYTPATNGTVTFSTDTSTGDSFMAIHALTGAPPITYSDLTQQATADDNVGGGDALIRSE